MKDHAINGLLDTSLNNLKSLVDVNSIIGEAITSPDGTTIIPISKVTFGFASGGSDLPSTKQPELFGGGSGGGVTIQPVAFLVIHTDGRVELLQMNTANSTADRAVNIIPDVIDKISGLVNKGNKAEKKNDAKTGAEDPLL